MENLWVIKATLKNFELVLGLGVNIHKSSVIEINYDPSLLEVVDNLLNCKIESLPFKYLGLPIRANPQLEFIWEPLVNLVKKKASFLKL